MKRDESVPKITPSIIAKANERMESPPKMNIANSTINVDTEVLTVRANVWLSDSLNRR